MRAALALILVACAGAPGHPPIARIRATPTVIPEHDAFQTDVILDGTASADPIDDPEGAIPLRYRWELDNDEARLQPGSSLDDPTITVRFLGARSPTIQLTVTDDEGLSSTDRLQLQLTLE